MSTPGISSDSPCMHAFMSQINLRTRKDGNSSALSKLVSEHEHNVPQRDQIESYILYLLKHGATIDTLQTSGHDDNRVPVNHRCRPWPFTRGAVR